MEKPLKCITVKEARDLQDNWKGSRGKEIERGQGYKDTREFWYSLDELQEYLDYVRVKSVAQGAKNPGIRVYLGAYLKTPQKKSYSTLFIAPTKENTPLAESDTITQENNYEIEPLNHNHGSWPPEEY